MVESPVFVIYVSDAWVRIKRLIVEKIFTFGQYRSTRLLASSYSLRPRPSRAARLWNSRCPAKQVQYLAESASA